MTSASSWDSRAMQAAENPSSATAACQAKSSVMTSSDKSQTCVNDSQTQTSSRTSEADSTSVGKSCKPFYDACCRETSSHLLSHTEIDSAASDSSSSSTCLSKMVERSWFSTQLMFHRNENSQKTCLQCFTSSHAGCKDYVGTKVKSRRIRIYPTTRQKNLFSRWLGVSRKFYNEAVDWYDSKDKDTVNWMEVAKRILHSHDEGYVKEVPYQVKKIAVKDAFQAFMNGCRKAKQTGKPFSLKFRSRKDSVQSCYIPKSAITEKGIYIRIGGSLKMTERHLLSNAIADSRLVREYGNKWYIVIPLSLGDTRFPTSENQGMGDVVAIDPGIRTFVTYFSENGHFGKIGSSFQELMSLHHRIDKLCSRIAHCKDKRKRMTLRRAQGRLRFRLRNLVDELHWKAVNFLVRNFSVIILPTFCTSGMVKKGKRKIRKSVVRAMQSYRFFEFSERLALKCKEYGVLLLRSDESYTSMTNSFTGELMNIGSKAHFMYEGVRVDRGLNGARNILLRAVRDSSLCSNAHV